MLECDQCYIIIDKIHYRQTVNKLVHTSVIQFTENH